MPAHETAIVDETVEVPPLIPQLEGWIENGLNIMLIANHGVGKTTAVMDAVTKLGLRTQIFSCSTIDPHTDFVGVPFARTAEDGREHLVMIRPQSVNDAEVIFLDEFNRAPDEVHNALFELIQFRTINGEHLPNLKCIVAAMNPPGKDYNVEELDPALIDRFDVFEDVAAAPNAAYLTSRGIRASVAKALVAFYNDTKMKPGEEGKRDVAKSISPRRLEKIGRVYEATGEFKFAIPNWFRQVETNKLREMLQQAEKVDEANNLKHVGSAQTGATRRFDYNAAYLKAHEFEVSEYLRDNQDDIETHNKIAPILEPRLAPTLVKDYGTILDALVPSIREAILTNCTDAKIDRIDVELAQVTDERRPLLARLIADVASERNRRA